jgi:hypothetical protein
LPAIIITPLALLTHTITPLAVAYPRRTDLQG